MRILKLYFEIFSR